MNKLAVILVAMGLMAQGCVKIDTEVLPCNPAPVTPVITNGPELSLNIGDDFEPVVTNTEYVSGFRYAWFSPDGTELPYYNTPSFSIPVTTQLLPGDYKLVFTNPSGTCHSDTASIKLNINYVLPSCGLADNTFKQTNSSTPATYGIGSANTTGQYYRVTCVSGNNSLNFSFPSAPGKQLMAYNIRNYSSGEPASNDVYMSYDFLSGGSYYGISGTIYVQEYTPGVMQITFCNVAIGTEIGTTVYHNSGGKLSYNP